MTRCNYFHPSRMLASLAELPTRLKGTLIDDVVILPYTHDGDRMDMYRKIKDQCLGLCPFDQPTAIRDNKK